MKTQRNMRLHLVIAAVVVAVLFLQISSMEFIMVIISISLVFICELINTAVEKRLTRQQRSMTRWQRLQRMLPQVPYWLLQLTR